MSGIAKAMMEDYVHEYVTSDQRVDIEAALQRAALIFGDELVRRMLRYSAGYGILPADAEQIGAVYEEIARSLDVSDERFVRNLTASHKYGIVADVIVQVLNVYGHSVFSKELEEIDLD